MPNTDGASIGEIISSTKLAVLYLSLLDIKSFNSYISSGHWRELDCFYFMIGSVKGQPPLLYWKYIVEIDGQELGSSILRLPDQLTEAFFIKRCHNVVNCSQFFDFSNLRELTQFRIEKCKGVEFIMSEEISLPRLETLEIFDMPDLRALFMEPSQCVFFESLKILDIGWCDNFVSLFSVKLFKQLHNLEKLSIWRCKQMKEMLMEEEQDKIGSCGDKFKLQGLKSLCLHEMPELESICSRVLSCSVLRSIRVSDCPKLKKLPISVDDELPALEEIKGSTEWWDNLEWEESNAKSHFLPFFKEDACEL